MIAAGSGITPDPVDSHHHSRRRAPEHGHADLRQPDGQGHHVSRGARGPEEPLSGPVSRCTTCCRARSRRCHFPRPHRRERLDAVPRSAGASRRRRRVVSLRPARDDRVRASMCCSHAASRASTSMPSSSMPTTRRVRAVEQVAVTPSAECRARSRSSLTAAARRSARHRWGAHPGRRVACALRCALRVQGRGLRHVPREVGQRQRRDGPALRAGAARDRRAVSCSPASRIPPRRRSSSTSTSDLRREDSGVR